MKMKAFLKTVYRMFKVNKARFALLISIITVSLFLCAGLGVTPDAMTKSFRSSLEQYNVSDILIKSTNAIGFNNDELSYIENDTNVLALDKYFTFDTHYRDMEEDEYYRIYYKDLKNNINKFELIEGRYPNDGSECLIIKPNGFLKQYKLGDDITIASPIMPAMTSTIKVVGIVNAPLYFGYVAEPYLLDTDIYLDSIIYLDSQYSPLISSIYNEISIKLNTDYQLYTDKYKDYVKDYQQNLITSDIGNNMSVLTLYENVSYAFFDEAVNKVNLISIIFPIFFILVCSLVVSISTSRLIADERNIIGCYYSLGEPQSRIINKYFFFHALIVILGTIFGVTLGIFAVPAVVHPTFNTCFHMGPLMFSGNIWIGMTFSLILLVAVLVICLTVIFSNLKESPAALLTYKAPKPGKKIWLEKIKFIWNRLSFKYKSSARNIFRYKKNMILTILSVLGSTVLVFVGLGLLDNSIALNDDPLYGGIADPIKIISAVVLLLASLLCGLIIFNLANMNISERNRELATLKVLGYYDIECSFYTFREIFTLSIIGGLLGLPVGYVLMKFVLEWLEFGSVNNINWYSYIISFVLIIVLTLIVNLCLYPKVKKIDMSDSLKTID